MQSTVIEMRPVAAIMALVFALAAMTTVSTSAERSSQDWRALCTPGNEVEILVGSSWYRGTVTAPDAYGEDSCRILNTSYTGREMLFDMEPDRMRSVEAPGIQGPRTGPAPVPGAPSQAAWRTLCVPGNEVEILIGSAWYEGTVIGPDEFGDDACGILNTSYSGREMQFAMAPDRMRAVQPPIHDAPAAGEVQRSDTPALAANLAEIGETYRTNIAAAREQFEGRTVTLTGTLQSVGSDHVRLTDGPFGVAMCTFNENDRGGLAALSPGRLLTVQGDDSSWGWGTFQLQSCRVLDEQVAEVAASKRKAVSGDRPPLGRYVCRQYMTTIGWIDLQQDSYVVSGVEGGYSFDPASGLIGWNGGAYGGWPARYEFSPAGEGHAHDEYIIRMTDEGGELKIDCFLTSE